MSYGYFKTEGVDGIDYSFYSTQTGRIYTVSFEMNLYVDYADKLPTLVRYGYGLLFNFQSTHPFEKGTSNIDVTVKETIADIVKDFLSSQPTTSFVVYECHDFKHEKFFAGWYSEFSNANLEKEGITFSVDDDPTNDIHFGFITTSRNKLLKEAQQEVQNFGISFMI